MKLTGFTDEAASDLEGQISVTNELGWQFLSARTVGDKNIHDLDDRSFAEVSQRLTDENIKVAEFGTLIGSWGKEIESDWDITLGEINRCIPRMQALGVQYARIMSYAQKPWGTEQLEQERFRRLREIVIHFKDAGLQAVHENCMNWGGFSADHTLRLLEEVPGLKLVFDTGNPVFQRDRSKPAPHPWQNALEFYQKVKHAVVHIHVKDGIMHGESGEPVYTFAGEGQANVPAILADLKKENYTGFIAIEPHMGKVFHLKDKVSDPEKAFAVYLEYGRKLEELLSTL